MFVLLFRFDSILIKLLSVQNPFSLFFELSSTILLFPPFFILASFLPSPLYFSIKHFSAEKTCSLSTPFASSSVCSSFPDDLVCSPPISFTAPSALSLLVPILYSLLELMSLMLPFKSSFVILTSISRNFEFSFMLLFNSLLLRVPTLSD